MFEGNALIRCLVRIGVLDESRMRLDYILDLEIEDFLELQLQTQVFKSDLVQLKVSIMPMYLSGKDISVLASKLSMYPPLLFDLIPKNILTLPLLLLMVVDNLVA